MDGLKRYFELHSDSTDPGKITLDQESLKDQISSEIDDWVKFLSCGNEPTTFTITPVWLTQQEFDNLPEFEY